MASLLLLLLLLSRARRIPFVRWVAWSWAMRDRCDNRTGWLLVLESAAARWWVSSSSSSSIMSSTINSMSSDPFMASVESSSRSLTTRLCRFKSFNVNAWMEPRCVRSGGWGCSCGWWSSWSLVEVVVGVFFCVVVVSSVLSFEEVVVIMIVKEFFVLVGEHKHSPTLSDVGINNWSCCVFVFVLMCVR